MKAVYLFLLLHFNLPVHSQNVGIGTSSPIAPLHIRSDSSEIIRIQGVNPHISFFNQAAHRGSLSFDGTRMVLGSANNVPVAIVAGNTNFGAYFTPIGRLGLGEPSPTERLHVNGNINLTGLLKINGNGGSSGQVLTSNGTTTPAWTNTALTNNIRFAVYFSEYPSNSSGTAIIGLTRYNLNPSAVVIGTNSITINQSGLYHFDFAVDAQIYTSTAPTEFPDFDISLEDGITAPFPVMMRRQMRPTDSSNRIWTGGDNISFDLYISAPATLNLFHSFGGSFSITLHDVTAIMNCYLISN